jgi:2-alkyl-3-oxoalkanoate reductase
MRVFVAGATGAVGIRLIPLLVSAGHSVMGLTRTPEKAEAIRRAGADVAVADALDAAAVREAVISAKPDVIVHEMTALSGVSDLRRFDRVFALTNRLRTEGLDTIFWRRLSMSRPPCGVSVPRDRAHVLRSAPSRCSAAA